ncbi:hypothetical protein M514_27691 [Trichuris suis]|uniref:Uncharacterized protein n=1 Tax=Trichuris suis TaxID=68888 RepID=A0A085MSE3_9BILA|nr:hypothetical protein M514_27691 [Trichuris suis]
MYWNRLLLHVYVVSVKWERSDKCLCSAGHPILGVKNYCLSEIISLLILDKLLYIRVTCSRHAMPDACKRIILYSTTRTVTSTPRHELLREWKNDHVNN